MLTMAKLLSVQRPAANINMPSRDIHAQVMAFLETEQKVSSLNTAWCGVRDCVTWTLINVRTLNTDYFWGCQIRQKLSLDVCHCNNVWWIYWKLMADKFTTTKSHLTVEHKKREFKIPRPVQQTNILLVPSSLISPKNLHCHFLPLMSHSSKLGICDKKRLEHFMRSPDRHQVCFIKQSSTPITQNPTLHPQLHFQLSR